MRNFTTEDFAGAGQYLIRVKDGETDLRKGSYMDAGYMSTIMRKVGWITPNSRLFVDSPKEGNVYTLTDMSDGMTKCGYFDDREDPTRNDSPRTFTSESTECWKWVQFNGTQSLVDYLNNPDLCKQEVRFATQEEVVRVVLYQKARWR